MKWISRASQLQYGSEVVVCDHNVRCDKHQRKDEESSAKSAEVPKDARVIRKMPWAHDFLGTVDHLCEFSAHNEVRVDISKPMVVQANTIRAEVLSEVSSVGIAYVGSITQHVRQRQQNHVGASFLPKNAVCGLDEPLLSEAVFGHIIMTAGLHNEQYY